MFEVVHVWTISDGKVTELAMYQSRDDGLKAVGLEELAVSQENVEVVRLLYDAAPEIQTLLLRGGDLRQHPWLSLWHPECLLDDLAEVPDRVSYRGREGAGD